MSNFNGWAIGEDLFKWIRENLDEGSTILELGSGKGTIELCKYYNVYSVEHDMKWVGYSESKYIYSPIVNNWYDLRPISDKLPMKYDLLLVDGPPGNIGRKGIIDNIDLFNTDIVIIIDDVNREEEKNILVELSKLLNRDYIILGDGTKRFGVI